MKKGSETKRALAFLLVTALIFANVGVTSATETANFAQSEESVVLQDSVNTDGTTETDVDTDTANANAETTSGVAIKIGNSDTSTMSGAAIKIGNSDTLTTSGAAIEIGNSDPSEFNDDNSEDTKSDSETTGYVKIGSTIEYFDELPDVTSDSESAKKKKRKAVARETAQSMKFDGTVPDVDPPTSYTEVYERMMALQELIPEGTAWNDNLPYGSQGSLGEYYYWKGGNIDGKRPLQVGCAAFVAVLSDAAFGDSPAKKINRGSFTFEEIKVGDILRVNNNSHSVIVKQTNPAGVVVAEGNNSGKVCWERTMSKQDVLYADFVLTRYPEGFVSADEEGADDLVDQGDEGNFHWTLTKKGDLTISGNGDMPNFSFNDDYMPSWSKTTYPVNSIVLESGITSIGDFAFYQSQAMSIDIPNNVTKIGDSAFYGSNLIGVNIPGSVKTVGDYSFKDCKNLATLTLAEGTETIGNSAFQGCTKMSGILNIPASVTSVGDSAFMSCSEFMSVQFASSTNLVEIKDNAFAQCWKMLSIKLPENLKSISSGLFCSCPMLTYLYIPASVQEISKVEGNVLKSSPFMSSSISQIDFGGSEETWKAIGGNVALNDAHMLGRVTVNFNVSQTTPEEPDPEDPNKPGTEEPDPEDPNKPGTEEPDPEEPNKPGTEEPNPEDSNKPGTEEPDPEDSNKPGTEEPDPEDSNKPGTDNSGNNGLETDTGSGNVTNTGTDSGLNSGNGSGTSTGTGTSSGWGSGSGSSTPSFPSTPSNSGNNSNINTGTGNGTSSGLDSETGNSTGSEAGTETNTESGNENVDNTETSTGSETETGDKDNTNKETGNKDDTSNKGKPEATYKYAQKIKGHKLYDSNNKLVADWSVNKKGVLTYKVYEGKKVRKVTKKNVVQVEYLDNGNLVYHTTTRFVKEIDHVTLKTRTLYKNAKKLVTNKKKNGFATKVKTKNGKTKKIVSKF